MNPLSKQGLPPNPYKRSPIKKVEELAGRSREMKSIRYYLGLTSIGQSPHLALIGQRGVGKTSLLNGAESIAIDLKLLPVRLNMNEQKANSQWIFWRDLYQTLALTMVKAGCWGGIQGTIYAELLCMIQSRQPGSLEKAVLQVPYVFSCHQGPTENFECPDALVVHDFEACLIELRSKGYKGIALLIDEADCLGKNVPLLQMFRNIFQIVEYCSLLLAGTEAVFPALSDVFSPIPRQFHRIDINPFSSWSDTMDLVLRPIPANIFEGIQPNSIVLRELHLLCGGAPDEVQLYCHHMYRSVEDGSTQRMSLVPQVFREVLREYRSNSTTNHLAVLNAVERLPDTLLFESKWLSRRKLTLEENIMVSILRRELRQGKTLSEFERAQINTEISNGYQKLYDLGITEVNNAIQLAGAALTAGFWKSYVEVKRDKRWSWDDSSYTENVHKPLTMAIGRACGAFGEISIFQEMDAVRALEAIRSGEKPREFDEGMPELIQSALFSREPKLTHVVDVAFQTNSPAGKQSLKCRFFEKPDKELNQVEIQNWINNNFKLLETNKISIALTTFKRWKLPSSEELHRLGRISGYRIPKVFGPDEIVHAIEKFANGNIQGCMDIFVRMITDKETAHILSNLAFCQILLGDISGGLANSTKAVSLENRPLYELNKGIAQFLSGSVEEGGVSLRNALAQLKLPSNDFYNDADFVLILDLAKTSCLSHENLTVDSAILINLWRMGFLSRIDLETDLIATHPETAKEWLMKFS
jgi:hypothetical protein